MTVKEQPGHVERDVGYKDIKALMADSKRVYKAVTDEEAHENLWCSKR
jgi:hypothetical protein